jgi:hypothetical protein
MTDKKFHEIKFGPFWTNVLDWLDKPGLVTADGKRVEIGMPTTNFVIKVDGQTVYVGNDNIWASNKLNKYPTGEMR